MKTEIDLRLEYKRSTGNDALEFDPMKQEVEIETNELRSFTLDQLESGSYICVECKIELDKQELINSIPYIQWLEEKIITGKL